MDKKIENCVFNDVHTSGDSSMSTYFCSGDKEVNETNYPEYPELIQKYKEGTVYIDPDTKRYQADFLFRKMIDVCWENELGDEQGPLIIPEMREAFYQWCQENTY